jgi:hypothetical protein
VLVEGEKHHLAANFCKDLKVPVLGRKDFFAIYRVTVDEDREAVVLEPYSDAAVGSEDASQDASSKQ